MMKCGHTANGKNEKKEPICVMCTLAGKPEGEELAEETPDLTGRIARCKTCGKETKSSTALPFFEHRPGREKDGYYCGCFGWD